MRTQEARTRQDDQQVKSAVVTVGCLKILSVFNYISILIKISSTWAFKLFAKRFLRTSLTKMIIGSIFVSLLVFLIEPTYRNLVTMWFIVFVVIAS